MPFGAPQTVEGQPEDRVDKLLAQLVDPYFVGLVQVTQAAQSAFELCLAGDLQTRCQLQYECLGSCVCVSARWFDAQGRPPIAQVRASPSARMQVKIGVSRSV